ncbi:hypothetical protein [Vibrio harveyi]|uniref:hypothetical protein n=1 Tax=Vibrio harveyi TaxID=669 RepID=UPI003BB5F4D2
MYTIDLTRLKPDQKCLVDTFRSSVRFEGFRGLIPLAVFVSKTQTTVTFRGLTHKEVEPLLPYLRGLN